ncbi:MAG: PIN domain-containing protein [Bacteroidales bacterium]|nr:PIN domain-containing protein [Bacteroidales bacterium]
MIRYLLDTNVLIDILRNKRKDIVQKVLKIGIDHCVVADVSVYELYCGAAASANPEKNRKMLEDAFEKLAVIPASDAYWEAAEEKQRLAKAGIPLEDMDLLIACTARVYGFTLITGNARHMERIRGLKMESWI